MNSVSRRRFTVAGFFDDLRDRIAQTVQPLQRRAYVGLVLRLRSREGIFTQIYSNREWPGRESLSGEGSDTENTAVVVRELPALLDDFGIGTILDIPCGDFHWMKRVPLDRIRYTGADIVSDLVRANQRQFGSQSVTFAKLDLLTDALPPVDLILCRDCLVHFSFKDLSRSVENICASQSKYLLTTTFRDRTTNADILTGGWRPLNVERDPLGFPPPVRIINEQCKIGDGAFSDKCLGLWKIDDIRKVRQGAR